MRWSGGAAALFLTSCATAADTHCTAGEQNVFSCRSGKRIISVCASKDLSANSGYIQYRFGAKDKVEMALPERPSDFRSIAFAGHLMFSGGGAEYVRFTNAAYSYVVYDGMGRGWGSRSGVAVETKGKLAATFACKGQPTADNGLNYGDVWSKAGMRIDSDAVASDIWSTLSTW